MGEKAADLYASSYSWGEALLLSLRQRKILVLSDELVRASTGLAAGVGETKQMCGALLAAVMAIGVRFGRTTKEEPRKPAVERSRLLTELFQREFGTTSCYDIVNTFPDFASQERRDCCARVVEFVEVEVEKLLTS